MNSENDGTVLSLSLKYVGRRRGAGSGGDASVARHRDDDADMRVLDAWRRGGAFKHLNRPATAAILRCSGQGGPGGRDDAIFLEAILRAEFQIQTSPCRH